MREGVLDGKSLLVYIDGNPIGCTTDAVLNLPDYKETILCEARSEFILTLEGHCQFGGPSKFEEMTYLQKIEYNWYRSKELPRKEKKAYRKRLKLAYGQELYRQQVMNYLDRI